jgi:hypothetical protein
LALLSAIFTPVRVYTALLLFEEAKRVLELMPKWEPAKDDDGNVVRYRFTLPVTFRLN